VLRLVSEPVASGVIYSTITSAWLFLAIVSWNAVLAAVAAGLTWAVLFLLTRAFYWWITLSEERLRGQEPTNNRWYRLWPLNSGRGLRQQLEDQLEQRPTG
jgi:lysylphosphatidylglycerol synthetase-like protein (DUF2156 family)